MPGARAAAMLAVLAAVCVAMLSAASPAGSYVTAGRTIWSIAGNGITCFPPTSSCGDGPSSIDATLSTPTGVAVAGDGTVYIGDTASHKIRKVTPAGAISTIAGNGTQCTPATAACGDGSAAATAQLSNPRGLALAADGSLYIADSGTHRIRRIAPDGKISTVAGNGSPCVDLLGACGDGGSATDASLKSPRGVAVDPGNGDLLIADSATNRIRKVSSGTISTVAGTGGICASPTTPCGDGGAATLANFNNPSAVAVDSAHNVYIADTYDNRIRRVSAAGTIATIAGTGASCPDTTLGCGDGGTPTFAKLTTPFGVAVAGSTIYIADSGAHKIRRVAAGSISTIAGTGNPCLQSPACGDGGSATSATLNLPTGVATDGGGNLFVADSDDALVRWLTGPAGTGPPSDPPPTTTTEPPATTTTASSAPPATTPATTTTEGTVDPTPPAQAKSGALVRCSGGKCRVVAEAGDPKTTARLRKIATAAQRSPNWARVELRRSGKTVAVGVGPKLAQALTLIPSRELKAGSYRLRITLKKKGHKRTLNRVVRLLV